MAATNAQTSWRIGFDIGGTFTDFILEDRAGGTVRLHKRLTSAHDPAEFALIGLDELAKRPASASATSARLSMARRS